MVIRQLDTLCHCNLYVQNTAVKEVLETTMTVQFLLPLNIVQRRMKRDLSLAKITKLPYILQNVTT